MRFKRSILAFAAAAMLPTEGLAAAQPVGVDGVPMRVLATLDACHPAALRSMRSATFGAQMMSVKGTSAMEVRFDLQQRNPGEARFRAVPAPGLGRWHLSAPGVGIYRYGETVASLPAPAAFRVLASYRWLNARKHVIRRTHRTTPSCVLPDERPRLAVGAVTVRRGADRQTDLYDVVVRNEGLGPAGAFDVVVSVAGQALASQGLASLGPHERTLLSFTGPRCVLGSAVNVMLDPQGRIDETSKAGDLKSTVC